MKNIFTLESRMLASLANPKRLEIIHLLSHSPLSVNQLVEMTGIHQANVSQHLSVLRRLGLVSSQKKAQTRRYAIASPHIGQIFEAVRSVLLEKHGVDKTDALNALRLHIDPVCKMELTSHNAASSIVHKERRYYFCGTGCEKKFRANSNFFAVQK